MRPPLNLPLRGGGVVFLLYRINLRNSLFDNIKNHLYSAIRILKHFDIRKSLNHNTLFLQIVVSLFVLALSFLSLMLAAIQFNVEFHLCTIKIKHISIERHLSSKFYPKLVSSQQRPEFAFCISHPSAQQSSNWYILLVILCKMFVQFDNARRKYVPLLGGQQGVSFSFKFPSYSILRSLR